MHRSSSSRRRLLAAAATAALGVTVAGVAGTHLASAATAGCSVTYDVSSQWPGGFTANVSITNLGDPITSWRLDWGFTAGQTVTQLWNGSFTQSGADVNVTNATWNGSLGTGAVRVQRLLHGQQPGPGLVRAERRDLQWRGHPDVPGNLAASVDAAPDITPAVGHGAV
jgi:hypothetical protein